ncbi:MAG: sugar kinase [Hyphomicrobiaceae bacterium]
MKPFQQSGQCLAIGECMVELARTPQGHYGLAFGGDTFNTAVYLARAGIPVGYVTALGDDPYSLAIMARAHEEGIATDAITLCPGRMPGLYMIETADNGERTFYYWRDRSPAREVFDRDPSPELAAAMTNAPLLHLSGITLSLYSDPARDRLADLLAHARSAGTRVAIDGNFRPRGWASDTAKAQHVMARFWRLADIALPTFDDEAALWGDPTPAATIERLSGYGVDEIALKRGAEGAILACEGAGTHNVPVPEQVHAIDTTAAGDSFNAAYLAARMRGRKPPAAALAGHRLAATVIQHRGAIAPAAATRTALATLM